MVYESFFVLRYLVRFLNYSEILFVFQYYGIILLDCKGCRFSFYWWGLPHRFALRNDGE